MAPAASRPLPPLRHLLAKVDRLLGEAGALRRAIDREAAELHKAVARSAYARLRRERDPHDPEVGSLARALRLRRLLSYPPH